MNAITAAIQEEVDRFDSEALGALRERFGIDIAELAAIRAFAKVVDPKELSAEFAVLMAARGRLSSASESAAAGEALFCAELLRAEAWAGDPDWIGRLLRLWLGCCDSGSDVGFVLEACAATLAAAGRRLVGERAVVYQLEVDILFALERLMLGVAAVLSSSTIRREQRLRARLEEIDEVTGLPNRHRFMRLLGSWLDTASDSVRIGLVVLTLEWGVAVQHLPVPDQDRLRLMIADALRDVVRPGDLLCATGDNEWSLLMPALRSPAQVRLAANRLVEVCESLLDGELRQLRGRIAAGGAVGPEHGTDPETLEHAARIALVVARQTGRGFEDYRDDIAATVQVYVDQERDFIRALQLQQFELVLQPQLDTRSGRCESAELLLRWYRDSGDSVAPPEVILLADRLGVLPQLSRWLIMHSVRMISELTAQGMALRLSLNLTAADMRDEELPDLISQGLRTWRVNPSQLTLEITETALLSDEVRVRQVIVRLRELGCDVALDDFGTGFSSLAYLRNLPVSELKIDQLFVRQLDRSERDRAIVDAVIRLGHGFGLRVVAEGVEDEATRAVLAESGCDLLQGYLLARPMPLDEFVTWYRARSS